MVDLGCGDGPLTLGLADRWPDARIVGVDSSAQMLEAARGHDRDGRVEWVQAGAEQWDPASVGAPIDVLVTNAALQWVPGHLDLFPGGWPPWPREAGSPCRCPATSGRLRTA